MMEILRDIMTTNPECCTPLDNVYEAAVKMRDLNVGAIPIVENGQLLGMVTDRDLVVRGIAEKHSGSNDITKVMSEKLITAKPDTSVKEAVNLMAENQIRRLPVVENGKLVGIVALGDLATDHQLDDRAGYALSEISERPELH
jgi:CBS domain-containing protein